jgi:hypothetical protein
MNNANGQIRLANVDIDDLPIYARTLVDEGNFFSRDVGRALRVLRRGDRR